MGGQGVEDGVCSREEYVSHRKVLSVGRKGRMEFKVSKIGLGIVVGL